MPLARPTLSELRDRVLADINSRIPGGDSLVRRSILNTLGITHAGAANALYGRLDWASRQLLPDTADAENLERWANIFELERKPGTFAELTALATGTEGTAIPQGAILVRADGARYVIAALAALGSGATEVQVHAVDAGSPANPEVGETLTFESPIPGVDSTLTVSQVHSPGGDAEADEELRVRVLARFRARGRGGAEADYVNWAREVSEVTRAWVIPGINGAGTVGVVFVVDDHPVTLIPDAAKVQEVADYIEDNRRPVGASVLVLAPVAVSVDLDIQLNPNTITVQGAVQAELADFFKREASPGRTVPLSRIGEAISSAPGETSHVVVSPVSNVTLGPTEIPVLGNLVWS